MKTFIQWEKDSPFLAFGREFKTNPKDKAISLWQRHHRPVEVRSGNTTLAVIYPKRDKVVYSDVDGNQLTL